MDSPLDQVVRTLREDIKNENLSRGMTLYGVHIKDILEELTPEERVGFFVWVADKMKKDGKEEGLREAHHQGFLRELQAAIPK